MGTCGSSRQSIVVVPCLDAVPRRTHAQESDQQGDLDREQHDDTERNAHGVEAALGRSVPVASVDVMGPPRTESRGDGRPFTSKLAADPISRTQLRLSYPGTGDADPRSSTSALLDCAGEATFRPWRSRHNSSLHRSHEGVLITTTQATASDRQRSAGDAGTTTAAPDSPPSFTSSLLEFLAPGRPVAGTRSRPSRRCRRR